MGIDWDELVPQPLLGAWLQWRSELTLITDKNIPWCYDYPKSAQIQSFQLHGFSDAFQLAYDSVVYLRMTDTNRCIYTLLVSSKPNVAPLTIPRLELCRANLLTKLLIFIKKALNLPLQEVYTLMDSTVVMILLDGNPHRFKTFVGNRALCIMELVTSNHWHHVSGLENPADCESLPCLFPYELLGNILWWNGPKRLKKTLEHWPKLTKKIEMIEPTEDSEICLSVMAKLVSLVIDVNQFSSFT